MIIFAQIPAVFAAICEDSKFDPKTRFHCAQKHNWRIFAATLENMKQTVYIAYLMYTAMSRSIPDAGNEVRKNVFWGTVVTRPCSYSPIVAVAGPVPLVPPTATRSKHSHPSIAEIPADLAVPTSPPGDEHSVHRDVVSLEIGANKYALSKYTPQCEVFRVSTRILVRPWVCSVSSQPVARYPMSVKYEIHGASRGQCPRCLPNGFCPRLAHAYHSSSLGVPLRARVESPKAGSTSPLPNLTRSCSAGRRAVVELSRTVACAGHAEGFQAPPTMINLRRLCVIADAA